MKTLCLVLMSAMPAFAQEALTSTQVSDYAARESAAPALATFEGGLATSALWIGIVLLCVVIGAVYFYIIEPGRYWGRG